MGSFRSIGMSKSTAIAMIGDSLWQAHVPVLASLFVAMMAFCFHQSVRKQIERFDLEMKTTSIEFVNFLVLHMQRLRTVNPALWLALSKSPGLGHSMPITPIEGPRLYMLTKVRAGVWQLLWPKLEAEEEASAVLEVAGWIGVVYGSVAFLIAWMQHLWVSGLLVLVFVESARRVMKKHSLLGPISVLAFLILHLAVNLRDYGWSDGSVFLAIILLPFAGSFKAACEVRSQSGTIRNIPLVCLLLLVTVPVWIGEPLERYLFLP